MLIYNVYYNILCYIPEGTGGMYGALQRFMLHPRVLAVYVVYYNILCYISHGTSGVYGVLHRFMLHSQGYWWYIWCTTSFNVISPRVLVVYMVYYIVLCYIPQDTATGGIYGVLKRSMLHPPQDNGSVNGVLQCLMLHPP